MKQIYKFNRPVESIFELVGRDEDDMTSCLGWVLASCECFSNTLAHHLEIDQVFTENTQIRLQLADSETGRTDVEIIDSGNSHIIIEAKRGFQVPSREQLETYANRLLNSVIPSNHKLLVVLAESDPNGNWLRRQVQNEILGIPVKVISWRRFDLMAKDCLGYSSNTEKRLLKQFINYLSKVANMNVQYSNYVYVVSLSPNSTEISPYSYIQVVEDLRKYYHPVGPGSGGWPATPPNYIGFRYWTRLQSIHHIESYSMIDDFHPHIPGTTIPSPTDGPHYLYELGPAIIPRESIPTNDPNGQYRLYGNGRKWVFIDLLLTSGSVAESAVKSRERENQ